MNASLCPDEHQSSKHINDCSDYLPVSSMSRQARCVQCGMEIGTEQYSAHLEQCLVQNEVIPNDSNIEQCPLCKQMVQNLLQHCQICMVDNDDENYELLGATSVPQVYSNLLSVPENVSISVVYFVLSLFLKEELSGKRYLNPLYN